MFVQATSSTRKNGKTYVSYLVRESFRTLEGPRSRTICNITDLPLHTRDLIAASLKGARTSFLLIRFNFRMLWTMVGWLSSTTRGRALVWANSSPESAQLVNEVSSKPSSIAYWLSARLGGEWRAKGEREEVPRVLRHLQTIRVGTLHIGPDIHRTVMTEIPKNLNGQLQKLGLTTLFASPPKQ